MLKLIQATLHMDSSMIFINDLPCRGYNAFISLRVAASHKRLVVSMIGSYAVQRSRGDYR